MSMITDPRRDPKAQYLLQRGWECWRNAVMGGELSWGHPQKPEVQIYGTDAAFNMQRHTEAEATKKAQISPFMWGLEAAIAMGFNPQS